MDKIKRKLLSYKPGHLARDREAEYVYMNIMEKVRQFFETNADIFENKLDLRMSSRADRRLDRLFRKMRKIYEKKEIKSIRNDVIREFALNQMSKDKNKLPAVIAMVKQRERAGRMTSNEEAMKKVWEPNLRMYKDIGFEFKKEAQIEDSRSRMNFSDSEGEAMYHVYKNNYNYLQNDDEASKEESFGFNFDGPETNFLEANVSKESFDDFDNSKYDVNFICKDFSKKKNHLKKKYFGDDPHLNESLNLIESRLESENLELNLKVEENSNVLKKILGKIEEQICKYKKVPNLLSKKLFNISRIKIFEQYYEKLIQILKKIKSQMENIIAGKEKTHLKTQNEMKNLSVKNELDNFKKELLENHKKAMQNQGDFTVSELNLKFDSETNYTANIRVKTRVLSDLEFEELGIKKLRKHYWGYIFGGIGIAIELLKFFFFFDLSDVKILSLKLLIDSNYQHNTNVEEHNNRINEVENLFSEIAIYKMIKEKGFEMAMHNIQNSIDVMQMNREANREFIETFERRKIEMILKDEQNKKLLDEINQQVFDSKRRQYSESFCRNPQILKRIFEWECKIIENPEMKVEIDAEFSEDLNNLFGNLENLRNQTNSYRSKVYVDEERFRNHRFHTEKMAEEHIQKIKRAARPNKGIDHFLLRDRILSESKKIIPEIAQKIISKNEVYDDLEENTKRDFKLKKSKKLLSKTFELVKIILKDFAQFDIFNKLLERKNGKQQFKELKNSILFEIDQKSSFETECEPLKSLLKKEVNTYFDLFVNESYQFNLNFQRKVDEFVSHSMRTLQLSLLEKQLKSFKVE